MTPLGRRTQVCRPPAPPCTGNTRLLLPDPAEDDELRTHCPTPREEEAALLELSGALEEPGTAWDVAAETEAEDNAVDVAEDDEADDDPSDDDNAREDPPEPAWDRAEEARDSGALEEDSCRDGLEDAGSKEEPPALEEFLFTVEDATHARVLTSQS